MATDASPFDSEFDSRPTGATGSDHDDHTEVSVSQTARLFTEPDFDPEDESSSTGTSPQGAEPEAQPTRKKRQRRSRDAATPTSSAGGRRSASQSHTVPPSLAMEITVDDPETVRELWQRSEGAPREQFARTALRIGVMALRQAEGQVDSEALRRESDRLLETLRDRLGQHADAINQQVSGTLREYFDPESGRFEERIRRLVTKDGELETLLRGQIGESDSSLTKTLSAHLGQQSPLMQMLSPDQSQGILASLRTLVEGQLQEQREQVLGQFSLDNEQGALARLVKELSGRQGELSEKLHGKIDEVVREFSLDEEDSALSRLVRNVDRAQRTITSEFSLDQEGSALARLKREMTALLKQQSETNHRFQEEVKVALKSLVVKREEMRRSTRHGLHFEDAVVEFIQAECGKLGDIVTATGSTTGRIKNCKVGDCTVQLGPDSAAAGGLIVIEAKEKDKYTLAEAVSEIETARKNRGAQVGLFVFSTEKSPDGLDSLARYGDDVVVVWDAANPETDVYLSTGVTLARALCMKNEQPEDHLDVDFSVVDQAILEIEKRAEMLGEVETWAKTIQSNCEKIMKRMATSRKSLARQSDLLKEQTIQLKKVVNP